MTLVCVRLDSSYRTPRIVALADTRASIPRTDSSWKTLSDKTVKLFALPVRCYGAGSLEPVIGAWSDPYFSTQIGLGFSGSCFEALTIIAHLTRMLGALVAVDGAEPKPEGEGVVNLIAKVVETYFKSHSRDGRPKVIFLVFGYDDGKPWLGEVSWDEKAGIKNSFVWATDETLRCIGDSSLSEQRAGDLIDLIRKHRDKVGSQRSGNKRDTFEQELEVERLALAEKKSAEEEILQRMEDEFVTGIGGTLQRLEMGCCGENVSVGYTHDDREYLDHANFSVTRSGLLGPIPIVEKMGRQIRTPTDDTA